MRTYSEELDQGRLPVEGSETLTSGMQLHEAFLLGLRQMEGFDVRLIARALGFEYPQEWSDRVEALESAGLVEFNEPILKLTQSGWLLTSSITEELLCPALLSICEATQ